MIFKNKTVKSIYDRTIAELKEVEELNEQRRQIAENEMLAAQAKAEAASDEVGKSRQAIEGFAKIFGLQGE